MEAGEVKKKILEVIDSLPENQLEDVLLYLKKIQGRNEGRFVNRQHLSKILEEDKELLKRLAQ